jgi:DNA-binding SARP family transcriptional activator
MRYQMLGPLRIWDGTAWTFLPAAQQRVVLAMLLANVGRVVGVEQLIDEIWRADPPRTALATVQVYVSRLRKMLGWGVRGPLSTLDRGYQLVVEPDDVDAQIFEGLATAGRRDVAAGRLEVGVERLSRALALWRGPALADVPSSPRVDAEIARLERARLTAMEERFGALLELRRPADVVDELGAVVRQHPLRERLWAQLMRALYQSGRRSEALATYRDARDMLLAELGLEPGPELCDTHRAVLGDDPRLSVAPRAEADRPVPAQLPADVAGFTGRETELRRLDALVPAGDPGSTAVLVATITGPAGVGKTALAVRWAHRIRDRFPDGQLYVNLHGYAGGGGPVDQLVSSLSAVEALGRFLAALGVRPERVPAHVDEAAALFRSLVSGKRMLVLLDNANHPDQVRPLLPGDARCAVVVTSRDRLDGLVARDGAARLALDGLRPDDARQLLARMLGNDRAGAEPAAVAELAQRCGHLPLALRLAGAHLSAHPDVTVAGYTDGFAVPDGARFARAGARV